LSGWLSVRCGNTQLQCIYDLLSVLSLLSLLSLPNFIRIVKLWVFKNQCRRNHPIGSTPSIPKVHDGIIFTAQASANHLLYRLCNSRPVWSYANSRRTNRKRTQSPLLPRIISSTSISKARWKLRRNLPHLYLTTLLSLASANEK
jgi:hypothetical protein